MAKGGDNPGRTILHVDMDQFYAAVEIRDNPALRGRPVVIGSDPRGGKGRGVVSTASYEARRFGVHSSLPISTAWRLCPQAAFLPVDMDKYVGVSDQIHAVFRRYTPMVEGLSLDEAFLDVTASRRLFGDGQAIARRIKDDILAETRLTCSVGVAENMFLAKTASDLRKPDGLVVVPPGGGAAFLAPLAIGRLWGVGEKSELLLRSLGLATIGDLAAYPLESLAARFGADQASHLKALARGEDDRTVEADQEAKSVGRETTFGQDTRDAGLLAASLAEIAEDVAARLRRAGQEAGRVTLKLRWEGFETHTRQAALKPASSHGPDLLAPAKAMLASFLASDTRRVRLIGMTSGDLRPRGGAVQLALGGADPEKRRRADAALDALNARFGDGTLKHAGGVGKAAARRRTGFSGR